MIPDSVILSFPYSGALYAFLSDQLGAGHTASGSSYYRTLFGKNHKGFTDLALTLSVLYKQLVMPAVDIPLPEHDKWRTDEGYFNKDLGIVYVHRRDEIGDQQYTEIEEALKKDQEDETIRAILSRLHTKNWPQVLRDARNELFLAQTHDCPIICSGGRRVLIQRLLQLDAIEGRVQLVDASSIRAIEEYIDISGLILNPQDLDALYTLKTSPDLRTYAKGFVEVVHGFRSEPDARRKLLELMREAIDKSAVAANAKGIFSSSSTVLSFVGLVPIIGTAAGVVGIGTDVGARVAEKAQRRQEWYQLSAVVQSILSNRQIEKTISIELAGLR